MIIHEFEQLTGFHPTTDLYEKIERAYMSFDGDKVEFCKAYVENRDNLASRIARTADEVDREIQLKVNSTIRELEKQNADLAKKLEAEQEWKLREDTDNVAQADYEELAGACGTEEMDDGKAKALLYDWYGFAAEKVKILHTVPVYEVNRHRVLRQIGEQKRIPLYNATDWNYVRFDCGLMSYELINGDLRQYIH